jgi:flagellar hook-associated protein 2
MTTTTSSSTSAALSTTSLTGLGLSGLSSGLDTSGIITKLMAIESAPQTLLQNQLSDVTTYQNSLQTVNTQLAAIATAAKTAATAGALTSFTAKSDTSGITATADSTAAVGSISFTVDKVAAAQVSVSGAMTTWPDTSSSTPTITITTGTGAAARSVAVTASSTNLDDVVAAINSGSTGVTATKVAAGTDANGTAQYRLQFRSNSTGAAGAFAVVEGKSTSDPDTPGTPLPTTTVASAQDASITLYAGTDAAQTVTSPSNTFTGLMTGVNVTVSAATTSAATVAVTPDSSKAASTASTLSGTLIALFSTIATDSTVTTSSSTSGGTSSTSTTGAVFTGDTMIRTINDDLLTAVSGATTNGKSPSTIGITLTKDGTITFDQDTFTAAMASDPTGTMSMFQEIAGRVADTASAASDPYTGTISQKITSEQSQESSLNSQISDWTTRLATIQQNYQNQFDNLETALNTLSSQSSYLTSQLTGLQTTYDGTTS